MLEVFFLTHPVFILRDAISIVRTCLALCPRSLFANQTEEYISSSF